VCRWCIRYGKARRLADALEEAYGPRRPEKGRKGKVNPEPAAESEIPSESET